MERRYKLKTFQVELVAQESAPRMKAGSPAIAAGILRPIFAGLDADREHMVVLALDQKLKAIGFKVCASGGMTEADVDPKTVFRAGLALGAVCLVVAHNHPSGDPTPSAEDVALTQALKTAGDMIGMKVQDHIILGRGNRFHSFRDSGEVLR
jgi:DNA repair protein RadC